MNGIIEPLPGLLDDPQFQITDLPTLTDFHIAPLRNPAPLRHANVPSPLEPVTGNAINGTRSTRAANQAEGSSEKKRTPKITPTEVLLAREAKKPHLAISELLGDNDGSDIVPTQLPSFISLSVVEKSPIQEPSALGPEHFSKRPRLEQESDHLAHDVNRQLPRPAQKGGRHSRPAPLLPAMVTGLHEPPPSAALLPSIDLDNHPGMPRVRSSKIKVKDILTNTDIRSSVSSVPTASQQVPVLTKEFITPLTPVVTETTTSSAISSSNASTLKESKARRARRKWTDEETMDLLAGVNKHGFGKWKQILDDSEFKFSERSSVDLKDRYRVCSKDESSNATTDTATARITMQSANATNVDSAVPSTALTPPGSSTNTLQHNRSRRKRRAWTSAEDAALIKGVTKHGFQWTTIHADPELNLDHRRATDLRDRIRNRFPYGYKHAESAPLRSEVKKAEKLHSEKRSKDPQDHLDTTVDGAIEPKEAFFEKQKDKEMVKEKDQPGVTLPSLTLDDDDMDWDNRLPPVLLPWDEIGIGM